MGAVVRPATRAPPRWRAPAARGTPTSSHGDPRTVPRRGPARRPAAAARRGARARRRPRPLRRLGLRDRAHALPGARRRRILELLDGRHVVLATPTGSGKSLVATFLHFKAHGRGEALLLHLPDQGAREREVLRPLPRSSAPENVGMMTGDAAVNRDAPIVCCTAEILANLALREASAARRRRGDGRVPLLRRPRARRGLAGAAADAARADALPAHVGDARRHARHRGVASRERHRPRGGGGAERASARCRSTSSTARRRSTRRSRTWSRRGKAPIYLVNFTQRAAAEQAQNLMSANFSSQGGEGAHRARRSRGVRFDTPYGKDLQRFLRHGVGLHHAGLLPKYRLLVEKLAQGGLLKVICGTDTLGVGVNIPIRTVLFTQLCKFDGEKTAILSVRDFQQIAGRAGRKGFDERGYVVAQAPEHVIENKKLAEKAAAGKKVVKKQPPQKGYVHWDRTTFERLREKEPEPLESRFEVDLRPAPEPAPERDHAGAAAATAGSSSSSAARTATTTSARSHRRTRGAALPHAARAPGSSSCARVEGYRGALRARRARACSATSRSTTPSRSTCSTRSPASPPSAETYALDVLTLVESILENPDVVLWKQLDRAEGRGGRRDEGAGHGVRRADGGAREGRVPEAEPRLHLRHLQRVRGEAPLGRRRRTSGPSRSAREMVERFMTFDDYVREYELQRSEGVLLRYLSETYKTLVQTVPESYRDDELLDVIAFLRATVRGVDSCLLDEWERLRDPAYAARRAGRPPRASLGPPPALGGPARVRRAAPERAARAARRARAARTGRPRSPRSRPGAEWTRGAARGGARALLGRAPAHRHDPRRAPAAQHLRQGGWRRGAGRRSQRIVDEAGEVDWTIECEVDLSGAFDPDRPLLVARARRDLTGAPSAVRAGTPPPGSRPGRRPPRGSSPRCSARSPSSPRASGRARRRRS